VNKFLTRRLLATVLPILVAPCAALAQTTPFAVTTYHYNNLRTGWNPEETVLSAAKFPKTFGLLETVAIDDQVDAQPLLVPAEQIAGGTHDVVYIVSENNTVYAIDASSGAILMQRNLGAPVPTPLGCGNNGPNVGITSTPVIDLAKGEMFLIAYINGTTPSYQLHALNLITLADSLPPVTVVASQTLTDGTTFKFNATYQRQRPGLLEMGGNIYAGFGSFCDFSANQSRGWVLGWKAANLAPLVHAELNDTQATSPTSFFLNSVWMSGFGLAAGEGNHVIFSTGNSDCNFYDSSEKCPGKTTYDGVTNIQESVISMQSNLAERSGVFTPSNVFAMDKADADLGASGVMLLPVQAGTWYLATIVSKDGRLWLLDQENLSTTLDMHQLSQGCWCGPSYFHGSDGIGRVISSAGATVQTWQVQTTPAPTLVAEGSASVQQSEQDPGFFTSVSSHNGNLPGAIIWAVARPSGSAPLTLYAFAAAASGGTLKQLYSSPAGQWPNLGGNADIVPVVANGKVYVASNKALMIFGPNGAPVGAAKAVAMMAPAASSLALPAGVTERVTGTLLAINGATLKLQTRGNHTVTVDISHAMESGQIANLIPGLPYTALADATGSDGSLQALSVMRAKPGIGAWPQDQL
jgi:outer membrane protein assembly factor BamB